MKPIILTADEIRAALAGTLTEIRRAVEPMPGRQRQWLTREKINDVPHGEIINGGWQMHHYKAGTFWMGVWHGHDSPLGWIRSPFGAPGDVFWCRETWASGDIMYQDHENDVPSVIAYRADKSATLYNAAQPSPVPDYDLASWNWGRLKWRSSTQLPLWASRLTFVTRAVRVERVADIWTWIGGVEVLRRPDGSPLPPREVKS